MVGPPPGRVGPGKDGGSPNHTAAKLKKKSSSSDGLSLIAFETPYLANFFRPILPSFSSHFAFDKK